MIKPSERAMGVEYAIRDVVLPARELEKKGIEVIRLNIGDPPGKYDFQPPEHMQEAYCRAIKEGHNYYGPSEGLPPEMREAVVQREKRKNGVDITPPMTSASQLPSPRHFSSSLARFSTLETTSSFQAQAIRLTPASSSSTAEFPTSTIQLRRTGGSRTLTT